MGSLSETYEMMLEGDQETMIPVNSKEGEAATEENEEASNIEAEQRTSAKDNAGNPIVITQPFFGNDKKYGSCPYCAAVIITKNEETTASCPNCKAQLALS